MTKHLRVRSIGRSLATGLGAALFAAAIVLTPHAASALTVPTDCLADTDGANDVTAKTDLTTFCANLGDGSPYELYTIINYDWVNAPSSDSDACILFDTDADAFANLAVCVTIDGVSNVATITNLRLFTCNDSKADRCAGSTLIGGSHTTACEVSVQNTDPFPGPAPGPGEGYPGDTELLCNIDLGDFGIAATSAVLQDACSYSSNNPNSNPSDCISFATCSSNADCDDLNACTSDTCDGTGVCLFAPTPGAPCDDGQYCNGEEECTVQGLCGAGSGGPVDCNDGVSCTIDTCDELLDQCQSEPMNSLCSDGNYCSGVETCDATNGCQDGPDPVCNDFVDCTADTCNESTDSCDATPNDAFCSNGAFCDGNEVCTPGVGCEPGTAPNCDDLVGCTTDGCDEGTDACTHAPSDAACDDNLYCNGAETCDATNDCQAGTAVDCADTNPCTDDSCNEAADTCLNEPNDANCDDGVYCNGAETCGPADCEPGTPVSCNDGVSCTTDQCNETTDACDHTPDDTPCSDNNDCNGIEFCDPIDGCQEATVKDCDDGIACTVDTCDTNGDCVHTPNDAVCDDGLYCTGADSCIAGVGCAVGPVPDCDDGIECTTDSCDEDFDTCAHDPDNNKCSDGLFCNGAEICGPSGCQDGDVPNCNDGVDCTTDSCDEAGDTCAHAPNDGSCDNGVFCDGAETCNPVTDCEPGTPPSCSDNVDCTVDDCDVATDSCTHTDSDAFCDDGAFCNGVETCDTLLDCQAGTAPNCDDAVGCTNDSCNETFDTCDHSPDNDNCDNGLFCDGAETCDAEEDCQPGKAPNCSDGVGCTIDSCDEALDSCVNAPNDDNCDNGVFCDGAETCDTEEDCQPGTPPSCNDNVDCTADECDVGTDACTNVPNDAPCSDGLFCTGTETCDPLLGCQAGTPINCNDNVDCSDDSCDESIDSCAHVPQNEDCSDGTFCNGIEVCNPVTGCGPGIEPCVGGGKCDEDIDQCVGCLVDADCSNGLYCDGTEICNAGSCEPGTPVDCGDGVGCTIDSCDEASDSCANLPNDASCDDQAFCNGVETCDATNDCQAGTAPNCSDNVDCTTDTCNESTDTCDHAPDNGACDDGDFCNGTETCIAGIGCAVPPIVDCDDGIPCTADSCNEATDQCDNLPDDTKCDNGDFCDGAEVCDAQDGCIDAADPDCDDGVGCTMDSCDEGIDSCVHAGSDAACSDNLFCNGTETCDTEKDCQAGTPVDCADNVDCTTDQCDEATDTCTHDPSNDYCDNDTFCDGAEICDGTAGCLDAPDPDCDDGVPCTLDQCDNQTEQCLHTAQDSACDDGKLCNGAETCDALQGCEAGTPPTCDDGVACTQDSCYDIGNVCMHAPSDAFCDNEDYCDGVETCDATNDCQSGTPPSCADNVDCTDDTCNEDTDSCDHTANDANCSDGQYCTGEETCNAILGCLIPPIVDCDDGVPCTNDSCNEGTDSCDNVADDTKCDNGDYCDGAEVCDELAGCQDATDPDCDDGIECTTDSCDEAGDTCTHTPHDALCDDALFCNGAEFCGEGGCANGTPPNCNDNVDCTMDACNEGTDMCDHTADNAACDDGLFCNGTETCNVMTGCAAGNNVNCADGFVCSTDACNEETKLCTHDLTTCVCGDMEQTGTEECDPPVMAGTFEDCNDNMDNDADGKIDCRDPDCKPGARDPICDEACTMDQVCLKFIRDPARVLFSRDGSPDEIYIHGRIPMEGDRLRTSLHAVTFELSNPNGPIYRAILEPGDMRGGVAGRRFRFNDRDARVLGQLSSRNGLERVWVRTRRIEGVRYLVFTVRAWGDFSKARHRLMTTELSVGPEVGFLTQEWNATPRGWILHQKNFDD